MKKLILLLLVVLGSVATMAQNVINTFPYTEDFDAFPVENAAFAPFAEPNPQAFPDGWINQTGDGADWYGRSTGTGSGGTGPTADHTSGSGAYVFVEDGSNNNTAVGLIRDSIDLASLTAPALSYWVSSFRNGGAGVDNYVIVEVWNGSTWTQVDSVGTLASLAWMQRTVDLTTYAGTMIDVRWSVNNAGMNFEHDIAIDDLSIFNVNANDVAAIGITAPAGNGRANTSTELSSTQAVTMQLYNNGVNSQSNIPVGFLSGITFGAGTATTTINQGDTSTHTFSTTVDMSAAGTYNVTVATGLVGDQDSSNDSITASFVHLANPVLALPWNEDFDAWTTETLTAASFGMSNSDAFDFDFSGGSGRLRTDAGFGVGGSNALTLDWVSGSTANNVVDITLNMSSYANTDSILFDFSYMDHGDESSAGDSIWVRGNDTDPWVSVYYLNPGSTSNGVYNDVIGINLTSALVSAGQTWSSSSQLRLGQGDNSSATTTTGVDGITFDNLSVYQQAQDNLKALEIQAPAGNGRLSTSTALTASSTVTIQFTNTGLNNQSSFSLGYDAGAGAISEGYVGTVNSGDTATHSFVTGVDLSAPGTYDISMYTMLSGDENLLDDTLTTSVRQIDNPALTLPWTEDFESATDATYTEDILGLDGLDRFDFKTNGQGNGRLRINPGFGAANSGTQALTLDRLTGGTVADSVDVTLNLSNYTMTDSLLLDFYYVDHGDENTAGDRVWVRGADTDPWIEIYDLAPASQTNGAYTYVQAINLTAALAGASQSYSTSTQLRFGQEDNSTASSLTGGDGITFDDLKVYAQPLSDMGIVSVDAPSGGCGLTAAETVTVSVVNLGFATLNSGTAYDVCIDVAGGITLCESTTLASNLNVGDTVAYTFTATADLSAPGLTAIDVWTSLTGDDDFTNDTLSVTINNKSVSSYPYFATFDALADGNNLAGYNNPQLDNGWENDQTDNFDWQPHNNQPSSGTGTGPSTDHTGLGGMYIYAEASTPNSPNRTANMQYPCFDFSSMATPALSYWYHMHGANMGSLYVIVDTNGTADTLETWTGAQQASNTEAWRESVLDLSGYAGQSAVAVRFSAVTGSGFLSDIALDDILIFSNGVFNNEPTSVVACEGDTVSFTADHSVDDTLQWLMDSGAGWDTLTDGANVWGSSSDTLWMVVSVADDGASIVAAAQDTLAVDTSAVASLTVGSATVTLGNDTSLCSGDSILLDAGAGAMTYAWSTGDTTQTIMAAAGATYYVDATSPGGCLGSDTIVVGENSPGADLGTQQNICGSDSVLLDAGANAVSGVWSTGDTTQTIYVTTPGTYYYDVVDADGCTASDTIVIGTGVGPTITVSNDTTVCLNDSVSATASGAVTYEWYVFGSLIDSTASIGGQIDTVADLTLVVIAADSFGCTSTDSLMISVNPLPTPDLGTDTSFCAGDSYTVDAGTWPSYSWLDGSTMQTLDADTAGSYWVHVTDTNGCVGGDTVMLTTISVPLTTDSLSICDGDSVMLGGAMQTTAGVYNDTLTAASGCDSVIATTLTVIPAATSSLSAQICTGDSLFVGGAYQTTDGAYADTLTGSNGCDSIVTTNLTVVSALMTSAVAEICDGDSIMLGGAMQTMAGMYVDSLFAAAGCDSIVTTTLTVIPAVTSSANAQICTGDSLFVGGAFQTTAGTYMDTLTAASGCDSVVTTNLTVVSALLTSAAAEICDGDSILLGGAMQTVAGTYIDSLFAAAGCDSIVTTTLTVLAPSASSTNVEICTGDSLFVGGAWQTAAGTYADTAQTGNGCDSIITTVLAVVSTINTSAAAEICDGDSILLGGMMQTTAGMYSDTLTAAAGCDSVVTTTLVVNMPALTPATAAICDGESILLGGMMQTTAGVYNDTLQTVAGCDSIIATTLTVNAVDMMNESASICDGDSILLGGMMQTVAGTYVDSLTNANGCDSIISTTLTILTPGTGTENVSICDGDSVFAGGAWQFAAGTYADVVQTPQGCDSTVNTVVTVDALPTVTVTASDSTTCVNFNGTSTLTASGAATYSWSPATDLDATTGASVVSTPSAAGELTYTVTGTDANGCVGEASTTIAGEICGGIDGGVFDTEVAAWIAQRTEQLTYTMGTGGSGRYTVEVYNMLGEQLHAGALTKGEAGVTNTIDLSGEASGMYILRLQSANGSFTEKVYKD